MFEDEIGLINKYLKKHLWMDFELSCILHEGLELHGFLDEADGDNIVIIFEMPYMAVCNFFFTYEGELDFISIVMDEEARNINEKYGVTKDNVIFKITNTNMEGDMLIIAKNIKVQILENENSNF